MKDTFDLRQFLTEHKLTPVSKKLAESVESTGNWVVELPNGKVLKYFSSRDEANQWCEDIDPDGAYDLGIREIIPDIKESGVEDEFDVPLSEDNYDDEDFYGTEDSELDPDFLRALDRKTKDEDEILGTAEDTPEPEVEDEDGVDLDDPEDFEDPVEDDILGEKPLAQRALERAIRVAQKEADEYGYNKLYLYKENGVYDTSLFRRGDVVAVLTASEESKKK